MSYFPDLMVDTETGGKQPDRTPMIQVAAVPFCLETMTISPNVFCRSLSVPPTRLWDESTRQWWSEQNQEILQEIIDLAQPPAQVMDEFWRYSVQLGPGVRFWAKPISFDYAFISSYFRDYELTNPFDFRTTKDLNSFIAGLYRNKPVPKIELSAKVTHNALDDCYSQIELLFNHYEATRDAARPT
jgi:hypothetical protein